MNIVVVEAHRSSASGSHDPFSWLPTNFFCEGLDCIERVVPAVQELLLEENPAGQTGTYTEVRALEGPPGMIADGIIHVVGPRFNQIPQGRPLTLFAPQKPTLDSVFVFLEAQAIGMKCQGPVNDVAR